MQFAAIKEKTDIDRAVADEMLQAVEGNPRATLCLATGGSPLGAYRVFVQSVLAKKIDLSHITICKLDEWLGVDMDDPCTCESFLQREIIAPLQIRKEQYVSFSSLAQDGDAEAERIRRQLEPLLPMDLVIVGMGKNGHIGLNEPDDCLIPNAHKTQLTPVTRTHAMLSQTSACITQGITLGFSEMFNSKRMLLIATGEEKEKAAAALYSHRVSTSCPCTLLHLHPNAVCYSNLNLSNKAFDRP